MSYVQYQIDQLEQFRGMQGHHGDLASLVESLGFAVDPDPEDSHRSEIKLQGCWHRGGEDIVVGAIVGDEDATII